MTPKEIVELSLVPLPSEMMPRLPPPLMVMGTEEPTPVKFTERLPSPFLVTEVIAEALVK